MKAMLLAAGVGSRLGPLTAVRPKCMVPVAGKPTLERNVAWLRDHGVVELVVNLHHAAEVVVAHFGNGVRFGVHIAYSREPELLGTAGALRAASAHLERGPFLVVYADNLIDLDLAELRRVHHASRAVMTMALYDRPDPSSSGLAKLGPDRSITGFSEKPLDIPAGPHWVNAGLLLCEPDVLGHVPAGASDIGRDLVPALLRAGKPVQGYLMSDRERLHWIDTPDDLRRTEAALAARRA